MPVMPLAKVCPNCFRSYPDITLNFCLEDGDALSDSFEFSVPTEVFEAETEIKRRSRLDPSNEEWEYRKTQRIQSEHPVSSSPVMSERIRSEWTSSDFLREITFQITGNHTFHAAENLEILRHFLNTKFAHKLFWKTTWQNGRGHFHSESYRFTYDFRSSADPNAVHFLISVLEFLGSDSGAVESKLVQSTPPQKRASDFPGFEYIRSAVSRYPDLDLLVHQGNNHRIMKSGHHGSIWVVPRRGGVAITATGQIAPRLYREMENLLGNHFKVDAKGYRYFQANDESDVEKIISVWSSL